MAFASGVTLLPYDAGSLLVALLVFAPTSPTLGLGLSGGDGGSAATWSGQGQSAGAQQAARQQRLRQQRFTGGWIRAHSSSPPSSSSSSSSSAAYHCWSGELRFSDLELINDLRRHIAQRPLTASSGNGWPQEEERAFLQKLRATMQAISGKCVCGILSRKEREGG